MTGIPKDSTKQRKTERERERLNVLNCGMQLLKLLKVFGVDRLICDAENGIILLILLELGRVSRAL